MSWNPPPNGQAGMMQRPPVHFQPPVLNSSIGPPVSGPPGNVGPPLSGHFHPPGPPLMGQRPAGPPLNAQQPPGPRLGSQKPLGPPLPGQLPRGPPSGGTGGVPLYNQNVVPPNSIGQFNAPPSTVASMPPLPTNPSQGDQSMNGQVPPNGSSGNIPANSQMQRPPSSSNVASELLPAPYHGKGIYSHTTHVGPPSNLTPTNSEPSSLNTSRVPSPIPNQHFDALEGQFRTGTPNSNLGTPPPGSPVPHATPSPRGMPSRPLFPQPNQPPASSHNWTAPRGPPLPHQVSSAPTMVGGYTGPPQPVTRPPPPGLAGPPNLNTQGQFPPRQPPPPGPIHAPAHQYPPTLPGGPLAAGAPPDPGAPPAPGYGGAPVPRAPAPGAPHNTHNNAYGGLSSQFSGMAMQHQVPLEMRTFNLLQERNILTDSPVIPPIPNLPEHLKRNNCSTDVFRCTLSALPQSNNLLQKSRLPLGILIHPFKDLSHLPVIQSSVIVRCRACRTYINPFVSFIDQRRWRCNLCFRANELPDEFNFDPVSKSYGSPERRPEIKSATIEFIAPSEYMLRPPQPCVYLYMLDVSYNALQSGYLQSFCEVMSAELDKIPGDSRTMIGFITYNSSVHFYNLSEELSTPQIHVVSDVEDIFLPLPDGLLANLNSCKALINQLLEQLPTYHQDEFYRDDASAMGAAMQAAVKLLSATGGRVTVVQTSIPNTGPGKIQNREDPNQRASSKPANLQPATDFYKTLSLEAAGQQIAIDMFLLNHQYIDHATIGGAARHCGGCLYAYPGFHTMHNPAEVERFEGDLKRYLNRKIGLEAVMRVRCTKGLAIHSFHGNFFVRSTDLLSLPNINPDAGFGMQVSIEDNLTDSPYASFQAALLYTSSKGERRIRVHTLCLPVTTSLPDVINGADQQAIIGLLSKMAVDRSINAAVSDAREALVNACVDALGAYGATLSSQQRMGTLPSPYSLRLLPLYVTAMLKHPSLRVGVSTKTDDRVHAMDQCKSLPLSRLMLELVPELYPVHALTDEGGILREEFVVPQPPRLALNSGSIDRNGAFLLDVGAYFYLWIGSAISPEFCSQVLDRPDFASIQDGVCDLPELENEVSERLRIFLAHLTDSKSGSPPLIIVREDSRNRYLFIQHMIEDKTESSMSYYEFLQHVQKQLKA